RRGRARRQVRPRHLRRRREMGEPRPSGRPCPVAAHGRLRRQDSRPPRQPRNPRLRTSRMKRKEKKRPSAKYAKDTQRAQRKNFGRVAPNKLVSFLSLAENDWRFALKSAFAFFAYPS